MSGELLRVRIDLARSIVTVVRRGGTPSNASTWSSQSGSTTCSFKLKRVDPALRVAPRALVELDRHDAMLCATHRTNKND